MPKCKTCKDPDCVWVGAETRIGTSSYCPCAKTEATESRAPSGQAEFALLSAGWLIEWKRNGQHKRIYVEHKSKMIQQYDTFEMAGYKKLKATELFKQAGI